MHIYPVIQPYTKNLLTNEQFNAVAPFFKFNGTLFRATTSNEIPLLTLLTV